jgi:hypothetical protein
MRAVFLGAAAAFVLCGSAPSHASFPQSGAPGDPLAKAQQYVAEFQRTFSSVMWHERYLQEDHVPRKFAGSGAQYMHVDATRQLESDMLLLWIPRAPNWMAVRDVISVDGKPRAEADRRLYATLARPDVSLDDVRGLAAANGRFNIGRIVRTFNEPTLTLLFLGDADRGRFRFTRRSIRQVGDRPALVYDYKEHDRPTIVRDDGHDIAARGSFWIDPGSGQVLQTRLELNDRHSRISAVTTVRYGAHEPFGVLVPLEMRETYKADGGEEITTVATYSNFRKFETAVRIIEK